MLNRKKLAAAIDCRKMTKTQVAQALGVSRATLYRRIKRGVFGADEIKKLVSVLRITEPMQIFFD